MIADSIAQGLAEASQDLGKSNLDHVSRYIGEYGWTVWMDSTGYEGYWRTTEDDTNNQFDQPGKKKSRRVARSKKALASGAAPLQRLRPAVRCPTQRYNIRIRGTL